MFCKPKKVDEAARHSKELENWLKHEHKHKEKEILLLGTGESGKTTIKKQMKIIHVNGYNEKEKKDTIPFIRKNLHESIYDIVYNMDKITPPITFDEDDEDEVKKAAEYILRYGPPPDIREENECYQLPDEYYESAKTLWNARKVQESFKRCNEYQLIDSAEHFLNRMDVIKTDTYVPDVTDILFCRRKTVGISKISFEMPVSSIYNKNTVKFSVTDVGGQRGERKKWIQAFSSIDAVLFLIAASDFDQKLREDDQTNRLKEAFTLFNEMCWNSFLLESGMIVFLNKQDLLKKKIEEGHNLSAHFPEFNEFKQTNATNKSEYVLAKLFMIDKIEQISKKTQKVKVAISPGLVTELEMKARDVYIHCTTAVDTNNIKLVFQDVRDIILKKALQEVF